MMYFKNLLCKFLGCFAVLALPAQAQVVPAELDLGGVRLQIPAPVRPLIQAKMQELRGDNLAYSQKLMQADIHLPLVGEVLEEQGVPEVFKYLALFDHHNQEDNVFWQMPEALTQRLGLQDENNIDESANLVSVTKAVAQNLKKNQGSLKSWLLTLIAFRQGTDKAQGFMTDILDKNALQNLLLNQKLDISNALQPELMEFVAYWALFKDALGRNPNLPTSLVRYKKTAGKTLKQIAEEYNIKLADLAQYNEWIAPDQPIPAGKEYEVLLPISTASPTAEVEVQTMRGGELEFNTYEEDTYTETNEEPEAVAQTHRVGKGETLFSIARKYNVSVGAIRQWNLMDASHVLKVGDEVKIGGNAPMLKPPQQENLPAETNKAQAQTHTVQAGEGLFKIARMYEVSAQDIRTWNKLASDNLNVGQKIIIKTPSNTLPAPKPNTSGTGTTPKKNENTPKSNTSGTSTTTTKITKGLAYSQRVLEIKTVPSEMTVLGMRLRLHADAKQKVQNYVNKMTENQPAYFKHLEIIDGYMPLIERELQKAELPLDFKLLPVQESMLKAAAVSKSNAVGYWQFKKESAVEEGIIVNEAIDERMNIVASTLGAINYLKKSQLMFDNWVNSLLSYNMGRTGAKNQIAKTYKNQNVQGVETMQITADTHWYVLKFLAHIIAYDTEIGISTPEKELTDYTQGAKKTLTQIAQENKTTLQALQPHNKWLKVNAVPVGKPFSVIVPKK